MKIYVSILKSNEVIVNFCAAKVFGGRDGYKKINGGYKLDTTSETGLHLVDRVWEVEVEDGIEDLMFILDEANDIGHPIKKDADIVEIDGKAAFVRETDNPYIWEWEADNSNGLMFYMEVEDEFWGIGG